MVSGLETRKIVLRHRSDQVVARCFGKSEEVFRHQRTNGVRSLVLCARMTVTVAEESRLRIETARLEGAAEDIPRLALSIGLG